MLETPKYTTKTSMMAMEDEEAYPSVWNFHSVYITFSHEDKSADHTEEGLWSKWRQKGRMRMCFYLERMF